MEGNKTIEIMNKLTINQIIMLLNIYRGTEDHEFDFCGTCSEDLFTLQANGLIIKNLNAGEDMYQVSAKGEKYVEIYKLIGIEIK